MSRTDTEPRPVIVGRLFTERNGQERPRFCLFGYSVQVEITQTV